MLSKKLYTIAAIMLICSLQIFAQVESTTSGGPWSSIDTWKDQVVPTLNDYVLIKGPVTLSPYNITEAFSIEITNLPDAGLAPDPSSSSTNKLFVANYLWNDGTISGDNLDIYIGGSIAGSIYNTANGTWNSGILYIVDTLSHGFLSEGKWFGPSEIRADSATLMSAGNIEIDSTSLHARKIVLGQNLQNEKFILNHNSALYVDDFISLIAPSKALNLQNDKAIGDTLVVKNNSTIKSYLGPGHYTLSRFTNIILDGNIQMAGPSTFIGDTYLNGVMQSNWSAFNYVYVNGNFYNNGEIKSNSSNKFKFYIDGNLTNNGLWNTYELNFTGTNDHELNMDIAYPFKSNYFNADNSTILSTSDIRFDNLYMSHSVLRLKKIVLQNNNSLFLYETTLMVDEFIGNGNTIQFNNDSGIKSYISSGLYTLSQFTDIILDGNIQMAGPSTFIGDTYLDGIMIPNWSAYISITVIGNFYNFGEIKGDNLGSYFKFYISGNLTNNGQWDTYEVNFTGTGDHDLSTDINYHFSSSYFNADSSTIYSKSDIKFVNTVNTILNFKKIVLQNNNSLYINNASLMIDSLVGNGNVVQFQNNSNINSYISQGNYKLSTFLNVNLKGEVTMRGPSTFIGDTYLNGTMIPNWSANLPITIIGNFYNNGEIKTNSYGYNTFVFNISGNLENSGIWLTAETNFNGTSSQHIGISDTSSLGIVKIFANRGGDSFQWMLDASPIANGGDISGATSSIITINNFDSKYFGTINCEIDSSGNSITSRDIIVNDIITEVEIDTDGNGDSGKDGNKNQIPKVFSLSQNYPNPFNPSTIIEYNIPAVETGYIPSVQLRIFDILGREVAVLVNEHQKPGYYKVNFDASSLSSGIYFYRISAGGFVQTKKMLLLK